MIYAITKKIMIHQRRLSVIIILFSSFVLLTVAKKDYSVYVNGCEEKYKKEYDLLIRQFEGKWSKSKQSKLDELIDTYDEISDQYSQLITDYLNHRINEKDLSSFINKHNELSVGWEKSLKDISDKMNYASVDKVHRYVTKTGGWNYYLNDNISNIWNLLFAAVLFINLFATEVKGRMSTIYQMCKHGYTSSYVYHLTISVVIAIVFSSILELSKILIYYLKYDIGGYGYPIQSFIAFEKCPWNISIWQWIAIRSFITVLGIVLFASLSAFCCIFFRNTVKVSIFMTLLFIIPAFVLNKKQLCEIPNLYEMFFPREMMHGFYDVKAGVYQYQTVRNLVTFIMISVLIMIVINIVAVKRGKKIV